MSFDSGRIENLLLFKIWPGLKDKKFNILASSFWNELDGGAQFHYSKNPARYLDVNNYKDISHDLILFESL